MKIMSKDLKSEVTEKIDPGSPEGRIKLAHMVLRLFDLWGLKVKDQLSLLGLRSKSRTKVTHYLEGEAFAKQRDLLDRAINLLSIQHSLLILYPRNREMASKWMIARNARFQGDRPIDIVSKEGFYGLLCIKRALEHEINPYFDVKKALRQAKLRKKKVYDVTKVFRIKHEVNDLYFDSIIRKGFSFYMARRLQRLMDLSDKDFAWMLGISIGVFRRFKIKKGRLSRTASDRLYRLAVLFAFSVDILESEESARKWFTSRPIPLGRRTPLEFAETEPGAREVEALLGRIRYGIPS